MIEWIVSSSVLILAVIVLRHVLKGKISLRLQYGLWALVLIRLLVPVSFGDSPVSVMNAFSTDNQSMEIISEPLRHTPAVPAASSIAGENAYKALNSESTATYNRNTVMDSYNRIINWGHIAKIVWIIGIAAVGLCLLISNIRFSGMLKRTRRKTYISNYPLPVYETGAAATPCMFGLLRPAIYVTPEVLRDKTALGHVLEHETTHWRHKDHIWSLLRCMCLALHWYNPLVWLAAAFSSRDSELACDEGTIRRIGEAGRIEYGRTLIGLTCAKNGMGALLCTATTMTSSKKSIKERIILMAKVPKTAIYTLVAVMLVAAIAVGCTFTGAKNKEYEIIPLTAEEIEQYNKTFEPLMFDEQGNSSINPLSHFFTSYYDKPEDINLAEFLCYFPSGEVVKDEDEFEALKALKSWPFGAGATLDGMPVPIHKHPAETVNETLKKHAGITLGDLSGVGVDKLIYLKEYDAYYNFTSDFAAGTFHCTHGEKQGDIVRLFNESTMLTLKRQGDDYLIVSHQQVGEKIDAGNGADATGVSVSVDVAADIPDAVIEYAKEFVGHQVDYYNEIGKEPPSGGKYSITDARITGLTQMNTGTASQTKDIQMWLLEYRLLPDDASKVILAGGMKMEEVDGISRITEWGSTGQPYLLLAHDFAADAWQRICVTNTDVITHDYGTPEMLELYGNEFTAAAMELYRKSIEIRTIGQVPGVYTREEEVGHTAVEKVAELLTAHLLDDLKTEQAGRSFTIVDWKNLSLSADPMYDAWVVTGDVEVRYEGILSPIGDDDTVPEGEYVAVSLGERHLKNENGVYILSLPSGEPQ